jgi:hypothetical protein
MKNINILKRKHHVGINVVFLELILTLYDVCFMQKFPLPHFDLHIREHSYGKVKGKGIFFFLNCPYPM